MRISDLSSDVCSSDLGTRRHRYNNAHGGSAAAILNNLRRRPMELSSFTIRRLPDLLERREISSRQIVEDCLRAIAEKDGELKAFVSVFEDGAQIGRAHV